DRPERPVIALAMGDPAGISAELTAKLLADGEVRGAAQVLVFGDRRVLAAGERVAGVSLDIRVWTPGSGLPDEPVSGLFVDLQHLVPASVELGEATAAGGRFALANVGAELRTAAAGAADAVVFTPFNKNAMRQALPSYEDEIGFITETVGAD